MMKMPFPGQTPTAPYVRYFQIVHDVIEENIASLMERSGKSRKEVCDAIGAQFDHCLEEWFSNREPNLNYQNPLCRLAYLYGVAPATASIVEEAFAQDSELKAYFDKVLKDRGNSVSICAFGGGPGTELLGICK